MQLSISDAVIVGFAIGICGVYIFVGVQAMLISLSLWWERRRRRRLTRKLNAIRNRTEAGIEYRWSPIDRIQWARRVGTNAWVQVRDRAREP